jgi:hypothetical protein
MRHRKITFALFALAMASQPVLAAPITLQTTLLGDPRLNNPDDLRVIVSVLGDTSSNVSYWTVDLDMAAAHPNARLDEFGFNLLGPSSFYQFSHFNLPYTPTGGTLNGSGGATFMLTLDDPSGNKYDATNVKSLIFQVTKTSNFALDDFLLAPTSCSSDSLLGCNQLGVHLQALNGGEGSGVALGNYPQPTPAPVPEPGSLLLLGIGAAGAAIARRRQVAACWSSRTRQPPADSPA